MVISLLTWICNNKNGLLDFPGGLLYIWDMKYLSLLLLASLAACTGISSKERVTTTSTGDNVASQPDIHHLLKLYKTVSRDTLTVESPVDTQNPALPFHGVLIDTTLLLLFPEDFRHQDNVFACYQFPLDDNTIGLVTRTPSEYESSSIKLFAWHKKTNTMSFETELAEMWGDAGDSMSKSSWLYRSRDSGWQAILEYYQASESGYPADTTVAALESYDYYHLKWNGQRLDTISSDSSALVEVYKTLGSGKKK